MSEFAFVAIGGGAILAIALADVLGWGIGSLLYIRAKRRSAQRLAMKTESSHD